MTLPAPENLSVIARFETNLEIRSARTLDGAEMNDDFIAACCWGIGREEGTALAKRKAQGARLTQILVERGLVVINDEGERTLTDAGRECAMWYSLKQLGA